MENKRVFLAIEFNQEIKNYLHVVQKEVLTSSRSGNFTIKDNFHLTLKFIGESTPEDIEKMKQCIDGTAKLYSDFSLVFDKLGQFPRGNKTILWLGLKANQNLSKLQHTLDGLLEAKGFKPEEIPYVPHITLGRQISLSESFKELSERLSIEEKSIAVEKISLMESTRVDEVLRYLPLYAKKLG